MPFTSVSLSLSPPFFSHLTTHRISSSNIPAVIDSYLIYCLFTSLPFRLSFSFLLLLTHIPQSTSSYSISRQSESGSTILRPLGRVLASSGRTNPLRTNLGRASANADGPCLFGTIRSAGCFFFSFSFFSFSPQTLSLAVGRSHPVLT